MTGSTETVLEAGAARANPPGKRFGWVAVCFVAMGAFLGGGFVSAKLKEPYEAGLRTQMLFLMQINSPVRIHLQWEAAEKEISGTGTYKVYSGPATYTLWNQSDQTIKVVFPPQNCFRFSEHEMSPRNPEAIPDWARESFVLTLKPKEERRFEDTYAVTTSCVSDRHFGPFAFDFSAPTGADPTEYVTGTVLCTMEAKVDDVNAK